MPYKKRKAFTKYITLIKGADKVTSIYTKTTSTELYYLAMQLKEQGKTEDMKKIFSSLIGTAYNQPSILHLVKQYFEEGDYDSVRKLLKGYQEKEKTKYLRNLFFLEKNEMNFDRATKILEQIMQCSEESKQAYAIQQLIHIKKTVGDLKTAETLSKILLEYKNFAYQAYLELFGINLTKKDFDELRNLLEKAKKLNLSCKEQEKIMTIKNIIENSAEFYKDNRYFETTDKSLYQHLKKHIEGNTKDGKPCFLKYINLPYLIEQIKEKMQNINPLILDIDYHYIIPMDSVIGKRENQFTKVVRTCHTAGNSNIVTMYPVFVSSEFNQEGYLTNKTILEKRKKMNL